MSAYAWAECVACNGGGAKWPNGPRAASVACEACRGVGWVCIAEAGPEFDPVTGRQTGGQVGTHPLGECVVCRGLVTRAFHEADKRSLQALDGADENRAMQRRFTEATARAGEHYEEKFNRQLEAAKRDIAADVVKQLQDSGVIPKQLEARKDPPGEPEEEPDGEETSSGIVARVLGGRKGKKRK